MLSIVARGRCGPTAFWDFYENGLLKITGIGKMADYNADDMKPEYLTHQHYVKSLIIDNGITHIGNYAFNRFESLRGNLVIPDSVTSIGLSAFAGCLFDGFLELGNSVESIDAFAFAFCTRFSGNLILPDSLKTLGEHAFFGTGFDGTLKIGTGLKKLPKLAFSNTSFHGTIEIPENISEIGLSCFFSCLRIKNLVIHSENMTRIGTCAFASCMNLSGTISIPKGCKSLRNRVFENSRKIDTITVYETTHMGNNLCDKGTELIILK